MDKKVTGQHAYQQAFELAVKIFKRTRLFPREEKFSLTDQLRRSSRTVAVSIAKASLRGHSDAKVDPDGFGNAKDAIAETLVWLEFAFSCEYISKRTLSEISDEYQELEKSLNMRER